LKLYFNYPRINYYTDENEIGLIYAGEGGFLINL